jgi:hypothetical protein
MVPANTNEMTRSEQATAKPIAVMPPAAAPRT